MNYNNQWIRTLDSENNFNAVVNLNHVARIKVKKFSDGNRAYAIYITLDDRALTEGVTFSGKSRSRITSTEYVVGFYGSKEDADLAFEVLTNRSSAFKSPLTIGQSTPIGIVVTAPTQKDIAAYRERKELVSKVTENLINQVGGDAK